MVPQPRAGQSIDQVLKNQTLWMVVPRDVISFDGSGCDKVGASFSAFRYQTGACKRAPQVQKGIGERVGGRLASSLFISYQFKAPRCRLVPAEPCLRNTFDECVFNASNRAQVCLGKQLKDLFLADKDRITGGKVPLYMVSQFTGKAGNHRSLLLPQLL